MRGRLEYPSRWDGVAFHGSNIKSGPNQDAELFNRQLERFPDLLISGMLDGIDAGMHKFDNMPYDVTVLGPPKLMTVGTPTIGQVVLKAKLLLWGEHSDFGISNSDPWKDKETITYVTVSGNVWNPCRSFIEASHIGDEYDEMDSLFWQSLSGQTVITTLTLKAPTPSLQVFPSTLCFPHLGHTLLFIQLIITQIAYIMSL